MRRRRHNISRLTHGFMIRQCAGITFQPSPRRLRSHRVCVCVCVPFALSILPENPYPVRPLRDDCSNIITDYTHHVLAHTHTHERTVVEIKQNTQKKHAQRRTNEHVTLCRTALPKPNQQQHKKSSRPKRPMTIERRALRPKTNERTHFSHGDNFVHSCARARTHAFLLLLFTGATC